MILSALLLATWTSAAPAQQPAAKAGQIYVNGRISRSLSGSVEIYEPWLRVNQWLNPWAGGASVSGSPLMGQVTRSGNFLQFFGSGVNANASEFGGSYRVTGSIRRPGQAMLYLNFMMQASGPVNNPDNPPSFHVWDMGTSLQLYPSGGGRDYSLSGSVDMQRFGAEGVALVGIIAGMAMQKPATAHDAPPQTPEEGIVHILPFPFNPIVR